MTDDKEKKIIIKLDQQYSEVAEWLLECRSMGTRREYESCLRKFFEWYSSSLKKTYKDFMALDAKAVRHHGLLYQQAHLNDNPNSVNNVLVALASFSAYNEKPISFRGKRVRQRPDIDSHIFNNGDLTKMFDVASTKEKALLSLMTSLGWEISAVLELERDFLARLIERAKAEDSKFIYFPSVRKKTGVPRLGVFNALALEWVEKWLIESKDKAPRKRKPNKITIERPVSKIFDMTEEGANKMLKRLAKDAGLVITGRLHSHRIRSWVISNLSRAGWNEWQVKYMTGKAIPLQDGTYLKTLTEEIIERYPDAYQRYLCIKPEKIVQVIDEDVRKKLHEQDEMISTLIDKLRAHEIQPYEGSELQRTKSSETESLKAELATLKAEFEKLKAERKS